jgi:dienelactone hydrolase
MLRRLFHIACACAALYAAPAQATMHTETIDYTIGTKKFQGFLAYDDARSDKLPGVLVAHDWMGLGEQVKARTKQVAALGYVAFAADIYGKGIVAHDHNEAGKLAGAYMSDRALLRGRMAAALDVLKKNPHVDAARLASMGYCFGGMGVLELARSGAAVAGTVAIHGLLTAATPADAAQIKGRVLALHGAEDPFAPAKQRADFEAEMRGGKVDWQMVVYGNTLHAFTVPTANKPEMGLVYSPAADARSWEALKDFLSEVLGPQPGPRTVVGH